MLVPVKDPVSDANERQQLLLSGSVPLAFLGVRTSYFFFLLFGVGLVSKVRARSFLLCEVEVEEADSPPNFSNARLECRLDRSAAHEEERHQGGCA